MTDSIIVFGRVCPSISQRQAVYQYSDRVILCHKWHTAQFDGPYRALLFAEPQLKDKGDIRQVPLAYTSGDSYENAIRALAARLHQFADELVKEPPAL
jgi:hypothetical protein